MDTAARDQEIFSLKRCGLTYKEIGSQFGLSKAKVQEICMREVVRSKTEYTFYDALLAVCEHKTQVTRIFKCLSQAGVISEMSNNHGSLDSYTDETLMAITNFGPASLIFARRANVLYKKKLDIKE